MLDLVHPVAQRLRGEAELAGDQFDYRPLRGMVLLVLNTIRNVQLRNSGEYFGDFFLVSIAPYSQELASPGNHGGLVSLSV